MKRLAVLLAALVPLPALAAPLVLKLGTLAATGSPWHIMMQQLNQDVVKLTGGEVKFSIYADGVAGDEPDLVKKLRIGQLQAAGMSTQGVSLLDDAIMSLHLPLMFKTYEELDFVRERVTPKLETELARKGFMLLTWTDGGWIYFFSRKPFKTPDELRKLKLFAWAGDQTTLKLYTKARFSPVPLATSDMLPALQTGLIDAFDTVPLVALINQWFGVAPYMLDIAWAPLMGGVVVTKKAWDKVKPEWRGKIVDAARANSRKMRGEIRKLGDDAVPAMVKRKLTVVPVDDALRAVWHKDIESFWPQMRGLLGPAEYYDEVLKLRDEYRAKRGGK